MRCRNSGTSRSPSASSTAAVDPGEHTTSPRLVLAGHRSRQDRCRTDLVPAGAPEPLPVTVKHLFQHRRHRVHRDVPVAQPGAARAEHEAAPGLNGGVDRRANVAGLVADQGLMDYLVPAGLDEGGRRSPRTICPLGAAVADYDDGAGHRANPFGFVPVFARRCRCVVLMVVTHAALALATGSDRKSYPAV